jgi:hypothetical protein
MNVRILNRTHPLNDAALFRLVWMLFCIALWALGLVLCETIIEELYFR